MKILNKYAQLLIDYCVNIKEGEKLFIQTTFLAEPLVKEVYAYATAKGAYVFPYFKFQNQNNAFLYNAPPSQLKKLPSVDEILFSTFDAYIHIKAPYNLAEAMPVNTKKARIRQEALQPLNDIYFKRTGNGELRRCLCLFPTNAAAQRAGMSLEEYQRFVFTACKLYERETQDAWLQLSQKQQRIVDHLNKTNNIHYKGPHCDLRFSCKNRIWINSDGKTNMPSGEVFTAPVDDSANGWIHFSYPAYYKGQTINNLKLYFSNGHLEHWESDNGKTFLDEIFSLPGARRLGEAAIGTNDEIKQMTKNILFDEKIGGTIHLALGQAYKQCNGQNNSSIHWDMITDMKSGGQIYADQELIYNNGHFIL